MQIIFVGISNKTGKNSKNMQPFEQTTQSGKILLEVEKRIQKKVLKTNFVPFAPADSNGKISYPAKSEIAKNLPTCLDFLITNAPCLVFLLGKIVEEAFLKNMESELSKLKNVLINSSLKIYPFIIPTSIKPTINLSISKSSFCHF